jgi:hypothetical protein
MKFHIKHISLRSAFKVGCLLYMLWIIIVLTSLAVGEFLAVTGLIKSTSINSLAFAGTIPPAWLSGIVLGGIIGIIPGLVLAFHAFLYNIVAHFFGGIVVTLERKGRAPEPVIQKQPKQKSLDEIEKQIAARRAKIAP